MTAVQAIFYLFSIAAVFSGWMVVISSNPVRSVLFLVFAFFCTSGIWLLLNAEFLALILVLVYVGAVMTLFLFVVMMLSVRVVSRHQHIVRYLPFALLLVVALVGLLIMALLGSTYPVSISKPADYNNIADLGLVLYTDYAYPFEIAAVLLLAAMIAAISLTHKKSKYSKAQNPSDQVAVRREDRVRLIKMKSEKGG